MSAAVVLTTAPLASRAEDGRLPAPVRSLLFFKVLTHVNNLAQGRNQLRVGLVSLKGNRASEGAGREVNAAVKRIRNLKVRGLSVSHEEIVVVDARAAERQISQKKLNILFLMPEVDGMLDELCRLAAPHKVLLGSGEAAHARRCAAFAVTLRENKAKVLVNVAAAKRQGVSFDNDLLRTVDLVK